MSSYKLCCPHCQRKIRVRSSVGLHPLMRAIYLQCTNEACGFTAAGSFEVQYELSASATPNPSINLPVAPSEIRARATKSKFNEQQDDLFDES